MRLWQTAVAATVLGVLAVGCEVKAPAPKTKVKRYGSVIGLKDEKLDYYKELHAACWTGVLKNIKDCNIQNYSIYLHKLDDGKLYLFSYFEYVGDDFKADMAKMEADPIVRKWWKETDPCQFAVKHRGEDEKGWAAMEEVFHCD